MLKRREQAICKCCGQRLLIRHGFGLSFDQEEEVMTAKPKKEFKAKIFPLLDRIDGALTATDPDLAMFALALVLGERIANENDDPEERKACFNVMMKIVLASVEEEET
jgi:hypothetical protein